MKSHCQRLGAPLRRWAGRFSAPHEIALGAALGLLLGLLPKANFFAIILVLLLLRIKVNQAAALLSACLFTALCFAVEPFLHRTGFLVLTCRPLAPIWTWLYNFPLAAWTGFNQTLIMGALGAGAYLACPAYLLTRWLAERYEAPVRRWMQPGHWREALARFPRKLVRARP